MATRTVRWFWIVTGSLVAIVSLAWSTFNVASLLAWDRQEFRETFEVADFSDIRAIDVDNGAGSVRIIGTAGEGLVVVDGEIVQGFQKASHDERIEGDTLVLDADCPIVVSYCNIDYEVQVPRDVDLRVRAGGGPATITGVDGRLDIESSGGGVRIENASGELVLRSSGGGVRGIGLTSQQVDASSSGGGVRLEFVTAPSSVVAGSSGGGVTVVVPDDPDIFYALDTSSSGGGVNDEIRFDPNSARTISAHSSGGGVTVRYPE
jgi:hypothetical protein